MQLLSDVSKKRTGCLSGMPDYARGSEACGKRTFAGEAGEKADWVCGGIENLFCRIREGDGYDL